MDYGTPHLFGPTVLLGPEKTFLVHVCYSQCISASYSEFHEIFINKKKLSLKQFFFSSHYMHETLLVHAKFSPLYSLVALTNHHVLCTSCILFYLQHSIISLVCVFVAGFSWTSTCSSYSYPLASATLAEVTANATSRAQTTPERAGVI